MATPNVVQRQLEQAEAALAQSMQPVQTDPNVVTDISQLNQPQQRQEPAPQPAPAPQPTPSENWEQKFKTLQGMFNAEVPQLRTREKVLESQMAAMQQQITALQNAKPVEQPKPAVDPKDVESFGADMIDMVDRYAKQAYSALSGDLAAKLTQYESRLATLEQMVNGVSTRTEATLEEQFYATVTQLVPNWKEINANQDFLTWLGEVDEVYGVPRQAALDAAHQRKDAKRVAAVFQNFISTRPAKPSSALANQVAPSSSGASEAPAANPSRSIITQKVVNQFYLDVAKGKYTSRPDEQKRIESEINLAARENRIV